MSNNMSSKFQLSICHLSRVINVGVEANFAQRKKGVVFKWACLLLFLIKIDFCYTHSISVDDFNELCSIMYCKIFGFQNNLV